MEQEEQTQEKKNFEKFYNKNYKKLLLISIGLVILSLAYLIYFYSSTGDIIYKDVTLTGGTTLTISSEIPVSEIQGMLSKEFPDISITSVSDNTGKQIKLIITVPDEPAKIKSAVEKNLNIKLDENNSSVEFIGESLSKDFYKQLIRAIMFAFVLMALVVFFVFGESKKIKAYSFVLTLIFARLTFPVSTFIGIFVMILGVITLTYCLTFKEKYNLLKTLVISIAFFFLFFFPFYYAILLIFAVLMFIYGKFSVPSIAVISSAFADILMSLVVVNIIGMKLSAAGIVAFLMLIGYSVDTDILLTTRVLKRKTSVNSALFSALKTGMTMTLTSIVAVFIGLIIVYNYETILNQIFLILIIGLGFDIFNTWITNAAIIKWYVEARGK